ncbi:MAG: pyridoxamine 5'-phosphate oxidase [Chloroflexota bacterium]
MEPLDESMRDRDPIKLFGAWFAAARAADLPQPEAMTLATADAGGRPSARMVLLKSYGPEGFVFFSNYNSAKAHQITQNPHAALIFFWSQLHRQVRIEGKVQRLGAAASDEYFATRARGSQIASRASAQSSVLSDRASLEARVQEEQELWEGRNVPRPEYWGGYLVVPDTIEFWQGRPDRLHDRFRYTRRVEEEWLVERLSP